MNVPLVSIRIGLKLLNMAAHERMCCCCDLSTPCGREQFRGGFMLMTLSKLGVEMSAWNAGKTQLKSDIGQGP